MSATGINMNLTTTINDYQTLKWLEGIENKSELLRLALNEYKHRHYDKVFINKEEFMACLNIEADKLKEAINNINELKEAVTKQDDKQDNKTREEKMLEVLQGI